ncbi:hypothetical protein PACTADRAFT_50175 [Pachysolen tannophilus NRRL Y-2460]|uniref:Cell division control protein 14 n=1 Tax=Pachysolen tannophilus NRRL Y-2460 TaxID=669874 RepID=A0A1E4TUK4_PACTA|nr:hypothetical protein PACTADRAFT_50175 [Pachysolen tannophilus NRRL Y-2460]
MSSIKVYLDDALDGISHFESRGSVHNGLKKIDALITQLCVLENRAKLKDYDEALLTGNGKDKMMTASSITTTSTSTSTRTHRNISYTSSNKPFIKKWKVPTVKDAVFGEFLLSQDEFQYNITSSLIALMLRVSLNREEFNIEDMILTNKILQGVLLLHPNSRKLFKRGNNLKLLLDYLNNYNNYPEELIIMVIQSLVCILVRNVPTLRFFEKLDGPKLICKIFIEHSASKKLRFKSLEFLFFYLIPETQNDSKSQLENFKTRSNSSENYSEASCISQDSSSFSRSNSLSSSVTSADSIQEQDNNENFLKKIINDIQTNFPRKTTIQKAEILKPYIKNIDGLINELIENKPFGNMNGIEW